MSEPDKRQRQKQRIAAAFGRIFSPEDDTLHPDAAIALWSILEQGGVFEARSTGNDVFSYGIAEGKRRLALWILQQTQVAASRYPEVREVSFAVVRGVGEDQ